VSVWAILLAAGRGERLGLDQPKAFAKLGEEPLLAEPLRRLDDSDWIDAIVIVATARLEEPAILLAEELAAARCTPASPAGRPALRRCAPASPRYGRTRSWCSARRGAAAAAEEVIERVLAPLSEGWDGVVPGLPGVGHSEAGCAGRTGSWRRFRGTRSLRPDPQAFLADVLRRGGG